MFSQLQDVDSGLARVAAQLDPALLSTADATTLFTQLTSIRNRTDGLLTLLAARVEEGGEWARRGHRHPEHWLAAVTGTSPHDARRQLQTSKQLADLPATTSAVKSGALSAAQTREIAAAAAASPASETGLLATAQRDDLEALHQHAERVKAAARSREAEALRLQRIHRNRGLTRWDDPDGATIIRGRFTPDIAAALWARLEADAWEHAKHHPPQDGQLRDTHAAQLADALTRIILTPTEAGTSTTGTGTGTGTSGDRNDGVAPAGTDTPTSPAPSRRGGPKPNTTLNVIVDWTALARGHTTDGETCQLDGQPIPVPLAQMLAEDCYLRVLVRDGTAITHMARTDRYIPPAIRAALEIQDPVCSMAGCHTDFGLQIDHNIPIEAGGLTTLRNLHRLCWWHHLQKTINDHRLLGPPGQLTYCTPAEWEAAQAEAAHSAA